MKLFLYLVTLLLLITINIYPNSKLDSLYHVSKEQVGVQRLETLYEIVSNQSSEDILAQNALILHNAAQKELNYLYMAGADRYMVEYHFEILSQYDSANYYIDRGLETLQILKKKSIPLDYAAKIIYDDNLNRLNHLRILMLLQDRENALAFKYIHEFQEATKDETNPKYKEMIHYQIGTMHTWMGNGKEAVKEYLESLQYTNSRKTTSDILTKLKIYYGIVDGYGIQQDYDNILAWCDTLVHQLEINEPYLKAKMPQVQHLKFRIYRYYSYSYASKGEMPKAKLYLDKCKAILPEIQKEYIPTFYDLQAYYYWKNKEYEMADKSIDEAIEGLRLELKHSRELYFYLMKANIMREWGKSDDAYDLLKKLYEVNDSINKGDMKGEIAAIESMHKVQSIEIEMRHQEKFFKTILGVGALIIFFVLIVLYIIWHNNKQLREKNTNLYHKHKKHADAYKENEILKSKITTLEEDSDPLLGIIRKLDASMKESKLYLDPNITREQVALEVATNRQYLIQAIKEKRGQSFNEYIFGLRLQDAYKEIVENHSITILEVFENSGFANRSHFNREFKREFGMTPSELQSIAKKESKKNID